MSLRLCCRSEVNAADPHESLKDMFHRIKPFYSTALYNYLHTGAYERKVEISLFDNYNW